VYGRELQKPADLKSLWTIESILGRLLPALFQATLGRIRNLWLGIPFFFSAIL
jgi:hypothetical protein